MFAEFFFVDLYRLVLLTYSAVHEKLLLRGTIMIRIFKFYILKVRTYEKIIMCIVNQKLNTETSTLQQ